LPDGQIVLNPYSVCTRALNGDLDIHVQTDAKGDTMFHFYEMDVCNPFWQEYMKKEIEVLIDEGADGIHFDEYNADNIIYPFSLAFGVWSKMLFSYQLYGDYTFFDIQEYVKSKSIPKDSEQWLEDPIWQKYLLFKSNYRS